MKLTPRDDQEWKIRRVLREPTRAALIADDMGKGKAQPLHSQVLTPTGFICMGDVRVGQEVVSPDGTTARVSGVFPQGEREIFEVRFVDGRIVEADGDHLWTVSTYTMRYRGTPPVQRTTREIAETLTWKNGDSRWSVQTAAPVDLGEWSSSLDPYLLGLLLGDGCITQASPFYSTADQELLDSVSNLLPAGVTLKYAGQYDYRLTAPRGQVNPLTEELKRLGLQGCNSWNKHIPEHLLNSSVADRLALLQGLLDTDGAAAGAGFDFLSASSRLAEGVVWLTRSLGGRATLSRKKVGDGVYHRVRGRLPAEFSPFRLARKIAAMTEASKYPVTHLAIKSIKPVGYKPAQCIMVDSPLHEYVTDEFTRTHNTLMGAEILLRLALRRTLIVGIRDTSKQWAATIAGQSDGKVQLKVMKSTVGGEKNFADFMAGEPGVYFAGVRWLTSRDWEVRKVRDHHGNPIYETDKKTGAVILKDRKEGTIGPAAEPKFKTEGVHIDLYGRKLVKRKTFDRSVDMVVFDEVHKMQNRHSQTAITMTHIKSTWRLGMSGTFAGNSFEGAWKVTRWLWPDLIETAFSKWRDRWCTTETPMRSGGEPVVDGRGEPVKNVVGELTPGAYVASLPCYIRDEPEEVPAPRVVKVPLTPEQREQYSSLEESSIAWLEAHNEAGRDILIADLPITRRQRLRTATLGEMRFGEEEEITFDVDTPSAKLNSLKYVIDNIWANQPVLIGLYSQRFAYVAAERLKRAGYGAVAWHGGISRTEREKIKEHFIAGDPAYRYLVATIPSIGTGVDGLQRACSKVAWLEESESLIDNQQFIKRIFRDGMTTKYGPFEHVKFVAEDTIDEGILARHDTNAERLGRSMRIAS